MEVVMALLCCAIAVALPLPNYARSPSPCSG